MKLLIFILFLFTDKSQSECDLKIGKEDYIIYKEVIKNYLENVPFKIDEIIIIKEIRNDIIIEDEFIDFLKEFKIVDKEVALKTLNKYRNCKGTIEENFNKNKNFKLLCYKDAIFYEIKYKNKNILFISFSFIIFNEKRSECFLALQEGINYGWQLNFFYLKKVDNRWEVIKGKKIAFY